VKRYLIKSSIS